GYIDFMASALELDHIAGGEAEGDEDLHGAGVSAEDLVQSRHEFLAVAILIDVDAQAGGEPRFGLFDGDDFVSDQVEFVPAAALVDRGAHDDDGIGNDQVADGVVSVGPADAPRRPLDILEVEV